MTPITHSASSSSSTTATMGPRGQTVIGASVLLNRHAPTPNEIATATPTTHSIHIFVDGTIPGTMNMVAAKRRKRSVEIAADIQYIQKRIRLPRTALLSSDSMFVCICSSSPRTVSGSLSARKERPVRCHSTRGGIRRQVWRGPDEEVRATSKTHRNAPAYCLVSVAVFFCTP